MPHEPVPLMPHTGGPPPTPSPAPQPLLGREPSNSLPVLEESQMVLAQMMMGLLASSSFPKVTETCVTAARTAGTRRTETGVEQATAQAAQAQVAATMPLHPATPSQRNGATCLAVGPGHEVAPVADLDDVTGRADRVPGHAPIQGTHGTPDHAAGHTQGQDHETGTLVGGEVEDLTDALEATQNLTVDPRAWERKLHLRPQRPLPAL